MSAGTVPLVMRRQRLDGLLGSLQLVRDPFPVTPDYESYFFSRRLQARYEELLSAVALRKGFVLVTGDVGVGKTTLARLLIHAMQGQGVRTALVINTFVQGQELLRVINRDFGLEGRAQTIEGLLEELHGFLLEQYAEGANCVLVIDDAQALTVDSLELLRQLSNLETSRHKLVQLVLVGQPELLDLLGRGDLRQLRSRIAMHLELEPMTLEEMDAYIYHRMAAAGNSAALTIDPDALRLLWERTGGYPRRVHLAMDRCVFGALARRQRRIDRALMREAIAEIDVPTRAVPTRQAVKREDAAAKATNWANWGVAALFVLAMLVAVVRLDWVSFAGLERVVARISPYVESLTGTYLPPTVAASERVLMGETRTNAPRGTSEAAVADGRLSGSAVAAQLSAPGISQPHALLAQIPEPVWQSFWARTGASVGAPPVTSLPANTTAALEVLDEHLAGSGLRSFLLEAPSQNCAEHAALRIDSGDGASVALFVLARVPKLAGPIEFGRSSEAVRWVQDRLRIHGLLEATNVDALLGPLTLTALAQFQRASGLAATGQLDPYSLYRLSCAGVRQAGVPSAARGRP